jgi:shikimate kinase
MNIVLIGMPGAGKSTIGVILAKQLKKPFIDTDLLIQQRENRYLQDIINDDGLEAFFKIEEEVILGLEADNHIIATGGSVIYSEPAIMKLKENGILVYLNLKLYQLETRIKNISTRGVAMSSGQTLKDIYGDRTPLYKKYADIEIDCSRKHMDIIIKEILKKLQKYF